MTYLAAICALQIAVIVALVLDRRSERREVAAERRDLLVRIQSPQVAVARDYVDNADPDPPAIDMSDGPMGDESYWLSREDLAEAMAVEEIK